MATKPLDGGALPSDYQNRRPDYVQAWWKTVRWPMVAERFAAVRA